MSDAQNPTAELPARARERLTEMRGSGSERKLFTSDLSVAEFLLIRRTGFEPAGLVMGSSIYHVGYQASSWKTSEEMVVLSQAMYHARELAMSRLEAEAEALGADGVIGVTLELRSMEFASDLLEFIALGTAVYHPTLGPSFRTKAGKPFTSDLTGQEFYTLLQSGYRPVGVAMGTCVFHVAHQGFAQWLKSTQSNQEQLPFTQALYSARELAMERMQHEAEELGAKGIVGVDLKQGSYGWASHVIEFFAIGTAVVPLENPPAASVPQLVWSVAD